MFRLAWIAAFVTVSSVATSAAASVRVYTLPQQGGYLLSACLNTGTDCGKPAADAWCQSNGFHEALTFQRERRETIARMLGSGAFCDGPVCETFRQIKCFTPASDAVSSAANN